MNNNGQKNKMLIIIIAILLLANIGLLFFAFWPKKRSQHGKDRDSISYALENKIGFSEEQMNNYEGLKDAHKQKMKPLLEALRTSKENFYNLLQQTHSDSVVANALTEIGSRQEAVDSQIYIHFRDIRSMCNPQQIPGFDSLVKKLVQKYSVPHYRKKSGTDSAGSK